MFIFIFSETIYSLDAVAKTMKMYWNSFMSSLEKDTKMASCFACDNYCCKEKAIYCPFFAEASIYSLAAATRIKIYIEIASDVRDKYREIHRIYENRNT